MYIEKKNWKNVRNLFEDRKHFFPSGEQGDRMGGQRAGGGWEGEGHEDCASQDQRTLLQAGRSGGFGGIVEKQL